MTDKSKPKPPKKPAYEPVETTEIQETDFGPKPQT